ncbi:hypothetical protein D3C75_1207650 [compost metagenome]
MQILNRRLDQLIQQYAGQSSFRALLVVQLFESAGLEQQFTQQRGHRQRTAVGRQPGDSILIDKQAVAFAGTGPLGVMQHIAGHP